MNSKRELAIKYTRKFKQTVFDSGIGARLPDAYKKFYDEWRNTKPQPVHYIPTAEKIWTRNEETGEIKRVEDVPLPLRYPKELNKVITGGEAVVQGFIKKTRYSNRVPRFWVPQIYRSVVYSEIHDKYLSTLMTKRAVKLIHEHRGLDTYLLETKACDLLTLVAIRLKRSLLMALTKKELPYDEEKNKNIYEKYKKYLIPPEEVEWYGLTFTEACRKLQEIEEEQAAASIIPFKQIYRTQFIEELKAQKIENKENNKLSSEESKLGWLNKLPGIGKGIKKS